ncbi:MAG: hypothetical protein QNJ51_13710 [Calothrix sp. MO_167.B12]|nr:hypothetical protein [Calothrix sp. MO_167.B12]
MPSPQEEIKQLKEELEGKQQENDELKTQLREVKKEAEKERERMSKKLADNNSKLQEEYAHKENTNREKIDLLKVENEALTNYINSLDSILEQLTAIDKANEEYQEGIDFLSTTKFRDLVPEDIEDEIRQKHSQQKSENQ